MLYSSVLNGKEKRVQHKNDRMRFKVGVAAVIHTLFCIVHLFFFFPSYAVRCFLGFCAYGCNK